MDKLLHLKFIKPNVPTPEGQILCLWKGMESEELISGDTYYISYHWFSKS